MSMTREEAITRLKCWLSNGTDGMTSDRAGYIEGWFVNADVRAFDMAIEALKEQRPHGEWIPCSERLPDMNKKVLCACIANIYEVLELRAIGWFYDNSHIYMKGFVLAWMPLPEPYKKEGDKE